MLRITPKPSAHFLNAILVLVFASPFLLEDISYLSKTKLERGTLLAISKLLHDTISKKY